MSRKEQERTTSGVVPFGGMLKPCDFRRIFTHETVKDVTLQEATRAPRTERRAPSKVIHQEKRTRRTKNLHTQDKARERRKKDGCRDFEGEVGLQIDGCG